MPAERCVLVVASRKGRLLGERVTLRVDEDVGLQVVRHPLREIVPWPAWAVGGRLLACLPCEVAHTDLPLPLPAGDVPLEEGEVHLGRVAIPARQLSGSHASSPVPVLREARAHLRMSTARHEAMWRASRIWGRRSSMRG